MLVLFPFEEAIYKKENIPVTYVGHPLADAIPMEKDQLAARARLGIDLNSRVLAILPGSRSSEIKLIAPRFLKAAQQLLKRDPHLICIVPMVNAQREAEFKKLLALDPVPNLRCVSASAEQLAGRPIAWDVLEACDVSLVASGTATLEAALFKCPMVISYVLSPLMRKIMAWKSGQQRPYLPWVGLPNVLSNDFVVPELLQDDAKPDQLASEIWDLLVNEHRAEQIKRRFTDLHHTLKCDTPKRAANAILQVLDAHR